MTSRNYEWNWIGVQKSEQSFHNILWKMLRVDAWVQKARINVTGKKLQESIFSIYNKTIATRTYQWDSQMVQGALPGGDELLGPDAV